MTARAKAELQQQDVSLTRAAVDAVDGLARRDPAGARASPRALRLALDRIVPDRDAAPWAALRQRFSRGRGYGVEEPLRRYSAAVASTPFDGVGVTQALLGEVGSSPSPTDSVILIWLLTATIERASEVLPQTDSGLRVLVEQRGGLVERLAGEVDEQTFVEPTIGGFDPEATGEQPTLSYLSPMEALLLDLSLASREAETPWLTFAEADHLFGERAHAAEALATATRRDLVWSSLRWASLSQSWSVRWQHSAVASLGSTFGFRSMSECPPGPASPSSPRCSSTGRGGGSLTLPDCSPEWSPSSPRSTLGTSRATIRSCRTLRASPWASSYQPRSPRPGLVSSS